MKRVLALLLCLVLVIGMTACGEKEKKKTAKPSTTATPTTTAQVKTYAHNEIINRFLVSFMELHKGKYVDTASLHRGKDLSEYIVTVNGCEVTIMDVSAKEYPSGERYALQFEIIGGTDAKAVDLLLEAFAAVTLAADRDCTTASTDNATEMLKKMTKPLSSRTRISDRVYVAYYTPVVDNEYTTQPCRISLLAKDDLVTNATTTAN